MTSGQRVTGFLVAAIIVIALADYIPHIVNGVLVLILAGVILNRSGQWTPLVNGLGTALSGNKTTSGSSGG